MDSLVTRRTFVQELGLAGAALASLPQIAAAGPAADAQHPAVLAVGGAAHTHTPGYVQELKAHPEVHLKHAWDTDAARAEKLAGQLGARVAADAAAVWSDPEVQGAVICSQTNLHHDLVLGGAKSGKHMFVEKPLGISGAESRQMAQAIEQAKVLFTTGYGMRTVPAHLFLKEQIDAGTFGKITRARASICHDGALRHIFDTDYRWMADPKLAGCGGFGDLGTHGLDLLMWLLGDVQEVTADIKVVTGRYAPCDESGEALLRFASGVTGTLAAGWVDVDNPNSLEISGTEAHAAIVQGQLYFKTAKLPEANGKKPWTKLPAALPQPIEMFIATIAGTTGLPLVTAREAAARVSVMEATYRSAAERKWLAPA